MSKTAQQASAWHLEGRFLGFVLEEGKLKRVRLMTADGEYHVKLAKELRTSVDANLLPGTWVQLWGEKKMSHKADAAKLKAYRISTAPPGQTEMLPATKRPASATILVCQKSDCMKRGGKAVCQALEAALSDRDLTDQVTIRGTGCMKQCKAGPNIVFMPEKAHYRRVSARDVAVLVDEQFPQGTQD
ncbi:MAG: (2Fe-2S) ferredoxin domain-containing protein [Tildeniella nuda ZEHNDER 1965/U140]|nr:(2Fe-2S) ferredoxin domain-containing protein [Tildeniella nuda ZEHNDER 1965/U140]